MQSARGNFTIWYLQNYESGGSNSDYAHDIKATNKEDLMAQAEANCPQGMFVKAIYWQFGDSQHVYHKIEGKSKEECWNSYVCERAFGA